MHNKELPSTHGRAQDAAPCPRQMAKAHAATISGEVQELLRKQAIYEVPGAAEGFLSSLFAVPKAGQQASSCGRPADSQPVHPTRALQNGGDNNATRSASGRF